MFDSSRRRWTAPAALPVAVPAVLLGVFALLLWQVVSHGPLTRLDVHVRNGIQDAAGSSAWHWLGPIGRGCADLGDEQPAILSLVLAAGLAAWLTRSLRPILIAAGASVVLATVIPLKLWVARPGPGQVVLGNANLGFFPSGHTADALCCYGTAAFVLGTFVWTSIWGKRLLGTAVVVLLALTIFGLLWSNYHWLTDILGSLCWCGAWLLVLIRADAWQAARACLRSIAGAAAPATHARGVAGSVADDRVCARPGALRAHASDTAA